MAGLGARSNWRRRVRCSLLKKDVAGAEGSAAVDEFQRAQAAECVLKTAAADFVAGGLRRFLSAKLLRITLQERMQDAPLRLAQLAEPITL